MGKPVAAEWKRLESTLNRAVGLKGAAVDYLAVNLTKKYSVLGKQLPIPLPDVASTAYAASVAGGVGAIAGTARRCRSSKLILAGYSQGAQVVLSALALVPHEQILAVTMFGNPLFHADSWAGRGSFDTKANGLVAVPRVDPYPGGLRGRLFDYCRGRDPICQGLLACDWHWTGPECTVNAGLEAHKHYDEEEALAAAAEVAALIRKDRAAKGAPVPEPAPSSTGPVDVVFAVDTTGSMSPVIQSVSDDVRAMASQLASVEPDFRLALVGYRDAAPYCEDDAYQAQTFQEFTSDTAAFIAAVGGIEAYGGCDTPESVFSGVMHGLQLPWRPEATKVLIAIGDAPGHDPDPGTDLTAADVVARAQADSIRIFGLDSEDASSTFSLLTDPTGGSVFTGAGAEQIPAAIQAAISAQASAPTAQISGAGGAGASRAMRQADVESEVGGPVGTPIPFSAAASWSPLGRKLSYSWDFDADGSADATTSDPVVAHTYTATYDGAVTLTVTDSAGQIAVARVHAIANGAPIPVSARPSRPAVKVRGKRVKVTWRRGKRGAKAKAYVLRDRRGAALAMVRAGRGRRISTKLVTRSAKDARRLRVRVVALNAAGVESAPSPLSRRAKRRHGPT